MSTDPKTLAPLAVMKANLKQQQQLQTSTGPDSGPTSDSPTKATQTSDISQDGRVVNLILANERILTNEFVAGCTAAFINVIALFPINKLIFRQMAGGHKTQIAAGQMKQEGLKYLYRGMLPPLMQKMASVSIMFGSYDYYSKLADRKFKNSPRVANLALASFLTGTTEAILTPLERVQILLQDRSFHKEYRNTLDALIKLRKFGLTEYYRGLTCILMRNGPSNILFFGLRDEIKKYMPHWNSGAQTTAFPQQQLANKSQLARAPSSAAGDANLLKQFNSDQNHHHHTWPPPAHNYGPNTPSTLAITTTTTTTSKPMDSMMHNFLSGAILGMFISTLFYPLSVVRTRMQTRAPGTEFLSIVKAFNAVYSDRDKKFSRLFRGCSINVMRQFMSWGIINCSYELMLDFLNNH